MCDCSSDASETPDPKDCLRARAQGLLRWRLGHVSPRSLALPDAGVAKKARRDDAAETLPVTFPETGSITYSPRWLELKRQADCNVDNAMIASSFRRFLAERGIARDTADIESLFRGCCQKVGWLQAMPLTYAMMIPGRRLQADHHLRTIKF